MLLKKIVIFLVVLCATSFGFAQQKEVKNATWVTTAAYMKEVTALSKKKLVPRKIHKGEVNPKMMGANKVVPGKGMPKGQDELLQRTRANKGSKVLRKNKAPLLAFEPASTGSDPSDPTGAVGPNHYVSALNSAFAIHDKNGAELVPSNSLANIWDNETTGDPIVFYDNFADRFVITQFDGSAVVTSPDYVDNGFLIAVSKGPDPVNDGWFTYRFRTGNTFPDYPKFSVWSDGYYITTNKDSGTQTEDEVIYVLERDKLLTGMTDAKMVGFPLPGSRVNGFYSPASFNAIGKTLPPRGNAKIAYLQDDAWQGVSEDALKFWTINVNWDMPELSTIVEAEELTVSNGDITAFDAVFDGGSFANLPQPGGGSIDAQQAVMMHGTNYRRFCNYNAVVLNFALDIDDRSGLDNVSAIRWYELRQSADGQPWTVYQEGTYASPDGKSAWCGSIAMDVFGNIGMGYTTIGTTADGATEDSFASIRYTGRLASDPLGTMTFAEEIIAIGTGANNTERYGDYAHITIDPVDDQTFWHIGEYFKGTGGRAQNVVGVFKIAENVTQDVGITNISSPIDATLTNTEIITVTVQNYGTQPQSNIPVLYSINGGAAVEEIIAGPIAAGESLSFPFATTADLSVDMEYTIDAETNLAGDVAPENDCITKNVRNLPTNDVGITSLVSPEGGGGLSTSVPITVRIFNFGGSPQSNIPVFYSIDGGTPVEEIYLLEIAPQASVDYTFETLANLPDFANYEFVLGTSLVGDQNEANNNLTITFEREFCKPTSDCNAFGDGITSFELSNVFNTNIPCGTGYEDFTSEFVINLNRLQTSFAITVRSNFANAEGAERFSFWIDFNDDTIFEESELILDNQIITEIDTDQEFTFSIGSDAPLGRHLLRIRGGDVDFNGGAPLNDPCNSMDQGTTHDYTVEIVEISEIPDTNLIVLSEPSNQFVITKVAANGPPEERIFIFNVLGQIVASNLVKKDGANMYTYDLDMSYASTGVYFARLGNDKKGEAIGFFVR